MLILVGKSCSGKSTIQKYLKECGLSPVLEYTTRPQRNGEVNHKAYHFISERDFINLKKKNFFVVTTSYEVNNGEIWRYGIALNDLSDEKMIVTNPIGLKKLKEFTNIYPVSFYINTDESVIWDRLIKRKDNIDEAQRRLIADREDFIDIYDYTDFAFKNNGEIQPSVLAEMIKSTYEKYISNVA